MATNVNQACLQFVMLLFAVPAIAHHSAAIYDQQRELTLQGAVTKFEWVSPHVYVSIETDEGAVWMIEFLPPMVMSKRGWSATSLAPGDRVVAQVFPAKDPARRMALGSTNAIAKADGTPLGTQASEPESPPSMVTGSLSGQWLPLLEGYSLYGELASERRPTSGLTEKGVAAIEAYDPTEDPLNYECSLLPAPYAFLLPPLVRIEIGEDETLIRREGGWVRTVHMNVDSNDGAEFNVQGHSIGWWEADALVVDTASFTPYVRGHGRGLPSGPSKHLVERFELNADRTGLRYTFHVEDPEYLSEPVTATVEFRYRPDLEWSDEPCDPEVARRPLGE